MKAAIYRSFGEPFAVETLPDPAPSPAGAVIRVGATGLCRSDWHGWMGHDPDILLPHVPGHEIAGVVEAVGKEVRSFTRGDRVTLPFVCACGWCPQCASGNHQVCDRQFQPGFTAWGSFAQYVAIDFAEVNLVPLPESLDFPAAASLGCRFTTSFRAVVDQGRVRSGQWVAVHGAGGVGLSAIMIAAASGARTIAVDIDAAKLSIARALGAEIGVNARTDPDPAETIRAATGGGAHLSIDALGSPETCRNSIACLRKRGIHVQVGLMLAEDRSAPIPLDIVIARELAVIGSHGMQAHEYPRLISMIEAGVLDPGKLVGKTISLEEAPDALIAMGSFDGAGVTIIIP